MSYANTIKNYIFDETDSALVRAAVYARVSTKNEGQKDSCENQVKTANDFVNGHKNIKLEPHHVFVDDGISGKSVIHRKEYQKLVKAIMNHEIDLIIAKTCSRLFRNVMEAQKFLNILLINNVVLLTLEDNKIWDFENQCDVMMFSMLSIFNANTSKVQSNAGKDAQKIRIRDLKLSAKDVVQGFSWDKQNKEIIINPVTSEYIKEIFEEYVFRNATPASISKMLKKKNMKFPKNRRDPETKEHYIEYEFLSDRAITNIILNPKYIGLFYINQRSSKFIPGQESLRYKLPKEEWVPIERSDLQIVDKELFEMAQRIHKSRINVYEKPDKHVTQSYFQGTHLFAGKIFCPVCGKPYHFDYADRKKTYPIYRIKSHGDCTNPIYRIDEAELIKITRQALIQVVNQQSETLTSLEKVLIECVKESQNNNDEIERLIKQKASHENKMKHLIDTLFEDGFTSHAKEIIKSKINAISEEIDALTLSIEEMKSRRLDNSYVNNKIKEIKNAINELKNFTIIDRDRVLNYIEKIEIPENGDINIFLRSGQIIVMKQHEISDFSVGKTSEEHALSSHLDNKYQYVFLTSFTYQKSSHSRRNPNQTVAVTVNCYLRTE